MTGGTRSPGEGRGILATWGFVTVFVTVLLVQVWETACCFSQPVEARNEQPHSCPSVQWSSRQGL